MPERSRVHQDGGIVVCPELALDGLHLTGHRLRKAEDLRVVARKELARRREGGDGRLVGALRPLEGRVRAVALERLMAGLAAAVVVARIGGTLVS